MSKKVKTKAVVNVIFETDTEIRPSETLGKVFIVKQVDFPDLVTLEEIPFPYHFLQKLISLGEPILSFEYPSGTE